ncbi:MAG: cobalamin-dependent protein, partial [Blautia sp.]|nr:cobalamin-dependent protein [Blautia sp.]
MIIIGEKLNGSIPAVARAIAAKDEAFIKERAKLQADAGATFLDLCASVEEDVETETLKWMIDLVQSVTDTPICVDSPSAKTCINAIPFCNKPGLVNSVSLEGDKIDTIFPVIADTDWECVALLCDNDGIPNSVEKRIEVFHGIMERAKEYGIAPSRLHIDPLVVTLSTDQTALLVFAECCRRIKAEYPDIHITSGLSNISYGLPDRKNINYSFMALAMEAGMDSAIVDPTNKQMLGIIYGTNALLGKDEFCLEYIEQTKKKKEEPQAADPAVVQKEKLQAVADVLQQLPKAAQEALDAGVDPVAILNVLLSREKLSQDVVGKLIEKKAAAAEKQGTEAKQGAASSDQGAAGEKQQEAVPVSAADEKLQAVATAVQNGKNKIVPKAVQEALDAGVDPMAILNDGMIGAMDIVGDNFKKQIIFVPQMLAAARAMKSGVEVLKPYLAAGAGGTVATMILGTVAGDFHDIGKNLVGMMIESAGVEVIDLGVDVPIAKFIEEINNHPEVTIVGLSALLTTTMPSLRDTVAALKAEPFTDRIKIMVGGAPISQEFADEIGADCYTPDAASAAKAAKRLALEMKGAVPEAAGQASAGTADTAAAPEGTDAGTSAKGTAAADNAAGEAVANGTAPSGTAASTGSVQPVEKKVYDTSAMDAIMSKPVPPQD